MKPTITITLVLMLLLSSCTLAEEYSIGTLLPLSGAGANLGQPTYTGMQMAVDEINAQGGINGRPLKLLAEDTQFDGSVTASATHYLLQQDVDIVTAWFHLPAQAASPIVEEAQKPFLYEAFTRSIQENPFAYKAHFDALTGCEELITYAKQHNEYEKLGVIMANVEYNQLCLEGIKKVEDVEEYWYAFGETDFRSLLTKAHEDDVDTLVTIMIDFEYLSLFKQLSELGYDINVICATASVCIFDQIIETANPEVLEGTLSMDFIPMKLTETDFATRLSVYYDASETELTYAIVGYEEILIIAEAMKQCKPKDSPCLLNALDNLKNYDSLIGSYGFEDRVLQLDTEIYRFTNGAWH